MTTLPDNVIDKPELRDRTGVFRDREDAGEVLARMLAEYRGSDALVLAIPAGGVPVAAPIAATLGLPLDLLVASKVLLPWTTEAGYGAVAFDGSVWINPDYVAHYGLDTATVEAGIAAARRKVQRREKAFAATARFPICTAAPSSSWTTASPPAPPCARPSPPCATGGPNAS